MKLMINEAPTLKSAVDSIVNLVEEGVFEIKKEGLHLRAMDPSQISMVSFTMPKTAFAVYEVDEEKRIGVDIAQLSNILSRGRKEESVELEVVENRLLIRFAADKKKRTFKIPLLDIGEGIQREPKIEYAGFAKLNSEAMKEFLKDAKLVSSHIRLVLSPEAFVVEVKGDSGDVRSEFEKGGKDIIEMSGTEARATFPLQYLEDIVKATSSATPVTLYIETDKPLKVEYEIEGAKAVYYLAPRIETE
ncbi:MAG: proliferating cell nuclear antigen (pcna) [Candidatus Bilamarchaeaceae archaeon]